MTKTFTTDRPSVEMASWLTVFFSLAFTVSYINIVCPSSAYGYEAFQHFIAVSSQGHDERTCLNASSPKSSLEKPCKTLDYAINSTRNATEVILEPGVYNLTVNATFNEIFNFKLLGNSNHSSVIIKCSPEVGFTFIRSAKITIQGITFNRCGRLHKSTVGSAFSKLNKTHVPFYAGVFFAYCRDITIENSIITNSRGIGLILYDVGGNVNVVNSLFSRNSPDADNNCTLEVFYARSGGGVYVEFTFRGALPPFNESDPERFHYQNDNSYRFEKCTFEENLAPEQCFMNKIEFPSGGDHMPFGRGGGLSFFVKGKTQNNVIDVMDCNFLRNQAVWGGGLFVEFQDSSQNNTLRITRSNFTSNSNSTAGGGIRSGIPIWAKKLRENIIIHEECIFENNSALLGGGVSHYGPLYRPFNDDDHKRKIVYRKCIWNKNKATMGSAIGLATSAMDLPLSNVNPNLKGPIIPYMAWLEDCILVGNKIIRTEDKVVIGQGALYTYTVPVALKGNTTFENNENTAVLLNGAILKVFNNTSFLNNTGLSGGGIGMYGMSVIDLMPDSKLYFKHNVAKEKGGAIYVDSSGPPVVSFETTEINTRPCFLAYNDALTLQHVDDWETNMTFDSNNASVGGGNSVYSTTLQGCRRPGEPRINNYSLQWNFVQYLRPSNEQVKIGDEVATDPIRIVIHKEDWNVSPGEDFEATINLIGEKGNMVQGVVKLSIDTKNSNANLGIPSPLLLIKDIGSNNKVPGLMIEGLCSDMFNVSLRTVSGQTIVTEQSNLKLINCNPGFRLDRDEAQCVCSKEILGISRCSNDKRNVYIRNGYWAGPVDGIFDAYACPAGYCSDKDKDLMRREFKLNKNDLCAKNRNSSVPLCGTCNKGYSVSLGSETCYLTKDCNKERLWLLLVFFLFMLVLVLLVLKINLDIFTAYLNAWLYSYQIILFLIKENQVFDRFISFVIGLANWRIHVTGFCFLPGLTNFYKLAINYILPFYVLLVLFVLSKISRFFPRCYINRNVAYALCNLLVLCYTDITTISFNMLHYVHLGDKRILFYDGEIDFYDDWKTHLPFTILAIVLVIFFVILLPLTLLFTPFFFNKFPYFVKFRLFFDIFQRCFDDQENGKNYRWFAAFYFLSRIWILLMALYLPLGPLKRSILEASCIVILGTVLYLKPYSASYKWLNTLDAVLLANLCLITVFSSALTSDANTSTMHGLKDFINILAYVPLVYLVGLAGYYGYRYLEASYHRNNPVPLMDETTDDDEQSSSKNGESESAKRNHPL